ncbi:MAG: Uridine kinase [Firmicutes bacterium]|nr:Uridine kinase [Bacillota bacterium]MBT9157537.1 Uridine kinase [Bacillota bacterium]
MPYIVGIAGGTGSGKSTLAENMIKHFTGQTLLIRHDNYYRDQSHLPMEMRVVQNYDHPAAFEDEVLIEHLEILRQGQMVWGPLYDFATHTRQSARRCLEPRELIIVEGILALHHPALRQLYDLKVFVDTDADIRILRRLTRDLVERGRTMESVVEQYIATVKPMHEQYVEPSKRHADVIIPEGGLNNAAIALIAARLRHALHMGASARGGEVFC